MSEMKAEKAPEKKPKTAKRQKKQNKLLRRILAGVLTVLLIALAVLVFVFRDNLSEEELRRTFGHQLEVSAADGPYTYESGTDQVFAAAGDGLAVASGSAVQLLDADGETVWKRIVSYGAPAAFGSREQTLFCDIGGRTAVIVSPEGESEEIAVNGEIITASMNENGWFALVTEAAGYKGLVQVYNAARELQYEWWSGSGYVLRAAVSPDNKLLAALCADSEGGKLHIFSLSSEEELAGTAFPDELAFDLSFMDSGTVCCLSESKLHFIGTDGAVKGEYDLGGRYLTDYDLGGDGFAVLCVSDYRASAGGELLTVSPEGEVLGSAELSRGVISLCARGRQILVMTGGDLTLFGQDLSRQDRSEALMTAKRAVLRPDGKIFLLSAYAAEQFRF